jgi:Xaa-Pro aminopeptidase
MKERIEKALKRANAKNIDAVLVKGDNNVRYYTGFTGDSSEALLTPDKLYFFTDFRYIEQAEKELSGIPGAEIIKTAKGKRTEEIFSHIAKDKRVGLDEDHIGLDIFEGYRAYHPADKFAFFSGEIYAQRAVKDKAELDNMAAASKINDEAFRHVLAYMKPGVLESEIAAEIIYYFHKKGLGIAFNPIVVAGEKSSLPHGQPSGHAVKTGDFVTMDFGCRMNGYCSDFTRTVAVGDADAEKRKVYELVLKAQKTALAAGKMGLSAKMLDNFARQVIIDEGYGECFEHGLGHGVGLDIHEPPFLNTESEMILEENMTVTIEPGIYIKGRFGVRIEDLCIVGKELISLNAADKQLMII